MAGAYKMAKIIALPGGSKTDGEPVEEYYLECSECHWGFWKLKMPDLSDTDTWEWVCGHCGASMDLQITVDG